MRGKVWLRNTMISILCLVLLSSNLITIAFADDDGDAQVMARQMINYFSDDRAGLADVSEISSSEKRVFGAFISNFYVPYETQLWGASSGNAVDANSIADKVAGIFGKNTSEDIKMMKDLIQKIHSESANSVTGAGFTASGNGVMKIALKGANDSSYGATSPASLVSIFHNQDMHMKITVEFVTNGTSKEYVLAETDTKDGEGSLFVKAMAYAMILNIDKLSAAGISLDDTGDNAKKTCLGMDYFGNIVIRQDAATPENLVGMVVLPACMNPMVFAKNKTKAGSYKLPVNNVWFMNSFVDVNAISDAGVLVDGNKGMVTQTPAIKTEGKVRELVDAQNSANKKMSTYTISLPDFGDSGVVDNRTTILNTLKDIEKGETMMFASTITVTKKEVREAWGITSNGFLGLGFWWDGAFSHDRKMRDSIQNTELFVPLDAVIADVALFDSTGNKGMNGGGVTIDSDWSSEDGRGNIYVANMFYKPNGTPEGFRDSAYTVHLRESIKKLDDLKLNKAKIRSWSHDGDNQPQNGTFEQVVYSYFSKYRNEFLYPEVDKTLHSGDDKLLDNFIADYGKGGNFYLEVLEYVNFNRVTDDGFCLADLTHGDALDSGFTDGLTGNSMGDFATGLEHSVSGSWRWDDEGTPLFATATANGTLMDLLRPNIYNGIPGGVNLWSGLYWAYYCHILDETPTGEAFGEEGVEDADLLDLPDYADLVTGAELGGPNTFGSVSSSEDDYKDMMKDIIRNTRDILSVDHNQYKTNWLKNIIDNVLLSAHNAIVGSSISTSNYANVGTKAYAGITSVVTTPRMVELPFTAVLVENFGLIYVFVMIVVLFFGVLMALLRIKTWKESILMIALVAVLLMIPNVVVDASIVGTNKLANALFSDRFDFWAIAQHQQYVTTQKAIQQRNNESGTGSWDSLYVATFQMQQDISNDENAQSGITLKWMSPKKISVFDGLYSSNPDSKKAAVNNQLFKWLMSGFLYQETYSADPMATYLYRPYSDLVQIAKDSHIRPMGAASGGVPSRLDAASEVRSLVESSVNTYDIDINYKQDIQTLINGYYLSEVSNLPRTELVSGYGATATYEYVDDPAFVGPLLESSAHFIPIFRDNTVRSAVFNTEVNSPYSDSYGGTGIGLVLPEDNITSEQQMFALYTESVFYYFYNVLKLSSYGVDPSYGDIDPDKNVKIVGNNAVEFSNVLLSEDFFQYIDRREDLGYMRDFLDMESLFTYVIPYLDSGNKYVHSYTSLYGNDVPRFFENPDPDDPNYEGKLEANRRHTAMKHVWMLYSPWVDHLKNSSVKNKTIKVLGDKYSIADTTNPADYPVFEEGVSAGGVQTYERPMVFGEADMVAKGLSYDDLTETEEKIQNVLKKTKKDMNYLVNYLGYDDEVLLSTAAMYATFNFNREFSKNSTFGTDILIYPQGYELKNFNYDAFLRLIYLNTTGAPISSSANIYVDILGKTSFITGILMLLNDVLACYIIPAMQLLILMALFVLGILIVLFCFMQKPDDLWGTIRNGLLKPLGLMVLARVLQILALSMIMGEGVTDLVGAKGINIATGDPTITTLLLILVYVVYVILLFKVSMLIIQNFKMFGKISGLAMAGMLAAGAMAVANGARRTFSNVSGKFSGGVGRLQRFGRHAQVRGIEKDEAKTRRAERDYYEAEGSRHEENRDMRERHHSESKEQRQSISEAQEVAAEKRDSVMSKSIEDSVHGGASLINENTNAAIGKSTQTLSSSIESSGQSVSSAVESSGDSVKKHVTNTSRESTRELGKTIKGSKKAIEHTVHKEIRDNK